MDEKLDLERTSSFHRSFYARQEDQDDVSPPPPPVSAASPRYGMPRNRGRRQSQRSLNTRGMSYRNLGAAAAPSGAPPPAAEGEPGSYYPRGPAVASMPAAAAAPPPPPPARQPPSRHNSWIEDAKQQGMGGMNLEDFFPADHNHHGDIHHNTTFDDTEVLEQYRIMAQHEASLRVKENTGFDAVEYEKRRKMEDATPGGGSSNNNPNNPNRALLYGGGKKPKIRLPDAFVWPTADSTSSLAPKPEEPPIPPQPKLQDKYLLQRQLRVPELCPGLRNDDSNASAMSKDEHLVRCLGCHIQLRVKILATLVSCSDCHTVSPASSTRR